METSQISFYFCVNIDTPFHCRLPSFEDGATAQGVAMECGLAHPLADLQSVPFDEWEHAYTFDTVPQGARVYLFTLTGWMNGEDAEALLDALHVYGEPHQTCGIHTGARLLPALSLGVWTRGSLASAYVTVLYKGEPCSAPSARRALRVFSQGGARARYFDTQAPRPDWTR